MRADPDPDWYFDHVLYHAEPGGGRVVVGPAAEWQAWWRGRSADLGRAYPRLAPAAARQGFVLRASQLAALGVPRHEARRRVRGGEWTVFQRGILAPLDLGRGADHRTRRRRHALECAAGALANPGFVVSGRSAAVLHGLPTYEIPQRPTLTAPPELRTNRALVATVSPQEMTSWFGVRLTAAARTALDLARADRRDGLMAADAALRERLVTAPDLAAAAERARGWRGIRAARELLGLASPLAESALESLLRLALHDSGLPMPQLQVEIAVPGRRRPYRVDLLWPEQRLVVEADGRVKYTSDELWQEKKRETSLRRLGYRVERVLWQDVIDTWPATRAHLAQALAG